MPRSLVVLLGAASVTVTVAGMRGIAGLLMFWAWVLGALGALLAIPLSLLVKALLVDVDPSSRWLSPLIGDSKEKKPQEVPG